MKLMATVTTIDVLKIFKSILYIYNVFKNRAGNPNSYRNMCLQNQLVKIFDMSFNSRLTQFIESENLMGSFQHGFQITRSINLLLENLAVAFMSPCIRKGILQRYFSTWAKFSIQ